MAGFDPAPSSLQPQEHVLVYDRIAKNRRQTWIMMLLFVVVLGSFVTLIGYLLGVPLYVAPVFFVALAAYAAFSYYASASVALAVSQAHEVTREEEPELYRVVENLCIGSGL